MNEPLLQSLFDEAEPRPMRVSELNAEVRSLLERRFANVWVEGEVVGFSRAASGHWYFNLNDSDAQIRCVCWKGTNYKIRFKPENGITVRIRGKVTLYEAVGSYQLVVESLEPSGEGALLAAFEQIKARLEAEGLFAEELKRPIPFFPRRVAVITSRSGAAFHDILANLARRARSVNILFAPAQVQGEAAADSIRRALTALNRFNRALAIAERIDVIIVGRGGGSAEDLWAFNDEALARAIRASEIPVISAVGHETDWSITDLIADLRAPTPTAAAELVAAREQDIVETFASGETRLARLIERRIAEAGAAVEAAATNVISHFGYSLEEARTSFSAVNARLSPLVFRAGLSDLSHRLGMYDQRRRAGLDSGMKRRGERLAVQAAKLDALSPLAVLTRGYSITQTGDGRVVRDASRVSVGDKLKIHLERGKLSAEVLASDEGDV